MNYSPVSNDLFTSFNKIGTEIDDIFSNLDIFSQSSNQCLKGGSSVDFFGPIKEAKPDNFTNRTHKDDEKDHNHHHFSVIPLPKPTFTEPNRDDNILVRAQSSVIELGKYGSSTPLTKTQDHNTDLSVSGSSLSSSCHTSVHRAAAGSTVDKEKELCRRHQHEIKELRGRILGLTERIQITVDERNKVFFKLEAAVREISAQGSKKEGLSQKVHNLNQKMLENDYEINQLRTQIGLLDAQIDSSQGSQLKLLDRLDHTYSQIDHFKEEREKMLRVVQRSNDECQNVVQKYQLLQKIHNHCSTIKDNNQAERDTLFGKVDELNRLISSMEHERAALIQNLSKVHKLVDKLERKATEKIQELSREMGELQDKNSTLRDSLQERDAVLSVNRATIRDLESKLSECEREINDVKRSVENHQQNNQETITAKNRKIKMLSLKVKQVQTRLQTQASQIGILTETNEKMDDNLRGEKLKNRSFTDECSVKDSRIKELEAALEEQIQIVQEESKKSKLQAELEGSIAELVQQKESIEAVLGTLEESNTSRVQEIEELKGRLSSTELDHEAAIRDLHSKLSSKERRIGRLKEGINQLVSARRETEIEDQELRYTIASLQDQFQALQQQSVDTQRDLLADLKEKSIQLEQYKELLDKVEFHGESRSKCYDMEAEYDFVSATLKLRELEAENAHLKAGLQKNREKHAKLKHDFGNKIREQNQIIDNCVDKIAAEKQIAELQSYYESRVSELELSLK